MNKRTENKESYKLSIFSNSTSGSFEEVQLVPTSLLLGAEISSGTSLVKRSARVAAWKLSFLEATTLLAHWIGQISLEDFSGVGGWSWGLLVGKRDVDWDEDLLGGSRALPSSRIFTRAPTSPLLLICCSADLDAGLQVSDWRQVVSLMSASNGPGLISASNSTLSSFARLLSLAFWAFFFWRLHRNWGRSTIIFVALDASLTLTKTNIVLRRRRWWWWWRWKAWTNPAGAAASLLQTLHRLLAAIPGDHGHLQW